MKEFYSLSKFPGKTGEHYYNSMFAKLGLDCRYTALKCTDIDADVSDLIKRGAAGISVSMPFKSNVIRLLSVFEQLVSKYNSCNTILINETKLHGFNTDYYGVIGLNDYISNNKHVSILGAGSMGSMVSGVFPGSRVYARRYKNWNLRHKSADVIINCTPYGTACYDSPLDYIPENTSTVIDLAINDNQLKSLCVASGVKYIDGKEFYNNQFIKQFEIYTGVQLTLEDINSL